MNDFKNILLKDIPVLSETEKFCLKSLETPKFLHLGRSPVESISILFHFEEKEMALPCKSPHEEDDPEETGWYVITEFGKFVLNNQKENVN